MALLKVAKELKFIEKKSSTWLLPEPFSLLFDRCWFYNSLCGDVLHLSFLLKLKKAAVKLSWQLEREGVVAAEWPGMAGWWFGNIGTELPPSDPSHPQLPHLILSSHDRERSASVFHPLCMDELYCIMFF